MRNCSWSTVGNVNVCSNSLTPNQPFNCDSTESYDRRDKPSVLVTSPGSPDLHSVRNYSANLRYPNRLTPAATAAQQQQQQHQQHHHHHQLQENSVGGRVQIKLGFDPSSLQLIVTIVGATDLVSRLNGAARNPYAKV